MIPWQADIGFLDRERNPSPPNFDVIMNNIEKGEYFTEANQYIQVVKDMPVHVPPHVFDAILTRFRRAHHVFLVRHPYHMIPSYFKAIAKDPQYADYTEDVIKLDTTYKPLLETAQKILGSRPGSALMLDAESLHAHPRESLGKLCNHIGVPFVEQLLQWEPHKTPSSWHDLYAFEGWLDAVLESSGWVPRPLNSESGIPPSSTPSTLK